MYEWSNLSGMIVSEMALSLENQERKIKCKKNLLHRPLKLLECYSG